MNNPPHTPEEDEEFERILRIACKNHVQYDLSRKAKSRVNRLKREFSAEEDEESKNPPSYDLEEIYRMLYVFYKNNTTLKPSHFSRVQTNRTFRERCEVDFIPFPEVDSRYERIRSRLVLFFRKIRRRFTKHKP